MYSVSSLFNPIARAKSSTSQNLCSFTHAFIFWWYLLYFVCLAFAFFSCNFCFFNSSFSSCLAFFAFSFLSFSNYETNSIRVFNIIHIIYLICSSNRFFQLLTPKLLLKYLFLCFSCLNLLIQILYLLV